MENNGFYGAPAGWYPDPLGLPQLRWWDSTAWTHQTAEARAPMVMQETTFAWPEDEAEDSRPFQDDDLPTRRERREQERRDGNDVAAPTALTLLQLEPPSRADMQEAVPEPDPIDQSANVADAAPESTPDPLAANRAASLQNPQQESFPSSSFGDAFSATSFAEQGTTAGHDESPFDGFAARSTHQNPQEQQTFNWTPRVDPLNDPQYQAYLKVQTAPHSKSTNNGAVWMIALIPLLQLVLSLLVLTAFGSSGSSGIMAAIWIAPYPITIALAALDRRSLRKTGHEVTAHWLWAFLSAPIYLIARAVAAIRESGGGFGPVLVWFALGLLQVGAIVAAPGLLISTIPAVFAAQAEQSIVSDAAVIGAKLEVTCPATPPVLIGQTFECSGVHKGSGAPYDIVVSLQRVNGWIDWRVDDWGIYTLG